MYLQSLTLCLFVSFLTFVNAQDNNVSTHDKEGWYYMYNKQGERESFFAIGAWHIPGYTPITDIHPDRSNDSLLFKNQARNVNVLLTHHLSYESFMSEDDRVIMTVNPSEFLRSYLNNIPSLSDKGIESGYYKSQFLKEVVSDQGFLDALELDIKKSLTENFPSVDLAFLPIDEVALGLFNSHWFVPPIVGDKIYEKIKLFKPNAIVYVDLTGHGKGSSFFFEDRYLKEHSFMPEDPPYEAITNTSARDYARQCLSNNQGLPLLVFNEGYNGVMGYQFNNGKYSYNSFTLESLKSTHYENIKRYAEAYQRNGNVFGINAFRDFHAHPVLAGVTVDAIRDGLDDPTIPIWLYFDGNGYAKPNGMDIQDYIEELKCQMYTSIIHGATGVFFWNDRTKNPDVWNALQPTLEEIKENVALIKLKTDIRTIDDNLHVLIKKDNKGQRYIIASNTSKTETLFLNMQNIDKKYLSPLEVYISPIK